MEAMKAIARIPFRIASSLVRGPAGFVLVVAGVRQRRSFTVPVASLDEARAQPIWFALRRAAETPQEQAIADRWLESLQICQVASSLLLSELDDVEANLRYWHTREQRGGHFWHNMLRRGPAHFVGRLSVLLHLRKRAEGALNEGDQVEKRVLIFRLLRSALCEALAQVQVAATLLYLQHQQAIAAATAAAGEAIAPTASGAVLAVDHAASAGDIAAAAAAAASDAAAADAGGLRGTVVASAVAGSVLEESLFQRADRMVGASMAAVAAAFQQLEHNVHATLDSQQGPAAAPAADWQVLQGALTRVLGLHHVRRVFSRLQLAQAGEAAAAESARVAGAAGLPAAGVAAAVAHPTAASLDAARQAVGYTQLLPANATVHSALLAARRSGRTTRGRRLIQVPSWARMPSELQQYWIRYTIVGAACTWGGVFMFRHSRLSGSPDLDNWLRSGVGMLRGAYADHVVGPLASVRDELFNTFRRRPTITSMADYEADRDSLQRMLDDFQRDFVSKRGAAATAADRGRNSTRAALAAAGEPEDPQSLVGMDLVMRTYEREMQRPLRNLVGGELVRALLIQVQKLKVDTASAMLEMDQILKANELSISLLAAVPAFVIAGASLFYMGRMVTPTPPDPRREALPVRMAFVEVERALEHVAAAEEAAVAAAAAGTEPVAEAAAETREQQGLLAYRLAVAYEEARELFRRHRGLIAIGGSEWPNIRSDLLELGGPAAVTSKMRTAQRMGRSYAIFQQF